MDKDKLKEVLQEILGDSLRHMVGDDDSDLAKMVNAAVQSSVEELQSEALEALSHPSYQET